MYYSKDEQIEALTEELTDSLMELGGVYERLGEWGAAIANYERLVELQADADNAIRQTALCYLKLAAQEHPKPDRGLERQQAKAALGALQKLINLKVQTSADLILMAEACWRTDGFADAARAARLALKQAEGEAVLEIAELVKTVEAGRKRYLQDWVRQSWEDLTASLKLDLAKELAHG